MLTQLLIVLVKPLKVINSKPLPFDFSNPEHYAVIGCPSCGAEHLYFSGDRLQDCFRCGHTFHPPTARAYLNNVHPIYQADCRNQFGYIKFDWTVDSSGKLCKIRHI